MPKKAPEEPKPLSFATPNPWSALPREVHVGTGHGKKEGATTESPLDGQDQPKIYTIRDHTLEVLMHPDVLELHAVRVVHTPHGDERQLHLKVRVRCGREEKVVDVLVDTGAQVSLVRRGLFKEEFLQPSRRPVRLKVANGEIMGGGTHEATISMEFWEHERLNRPDQAKRSTLSGNFYVADITDWDMIMGYDFMVANAIGALPHRATLVREDDECLTWLSTDYSCGSSQWNAEEEDRIVRAVQAVGAKSRGDRGVQLTEYGMAPQVYTRMIQTLGAEVPETDVFASRDAPLLRKCRRHWHRGDSAWHRHWGLKEWGPMYWHGSLDNTRRTVEKIIADRAKEILVITGIGSTPCPLEGLKSTLDSITLNEMSFGPEEELFIDAKGVSMPSPGQAWGTKAFLVDGAQAQPTGDEALIRRVEAVPMKVMFEPKEGTDQPVDGIDILSHSEIDDVVNYMRMGCTTVWQPRRGGPWTHLRIGGMTRCWSPASTRRMSSWRGSWITSRTNTMVRLGRTHQHGIFQEWVSIATFTSPRPQIFEDYRWEVHPTTMKTAYRTRRSRTRTQKRPIPQCGRLYRYRSKRLTKPRRTRRSPS